MTPRLLYAMEIILILLSVAMLLTVLWLAITGKLTSGGGSSMAALTAFHDFLPRDKQEAVEIVMEQNAGKQFEQQLNGEGNTGRNRDDESEQTHT